MGNSSCSNKYCVFWHPTIFHDKLTPIGNFASFLLFEKPEKRTETKTSYVIENEISDEVGKSTMLK